MYDEVSTGPLYDKAVQLLSTYRSVAARMSNARSSTQGKLDRRLEQLSERIAETLGELTDDELMALDCWKDGVVPGLYEVDHAALGGMKPQRRAILRKRLSRKICLLMVLRL